MLLLSSRHLLVVERGLMAAKMHKDWKNINNMTPEERLTFTFILADVTNANTPEHPFTPSVSAGMRIGYNILKKFTQRCAGKALTFPHDHSRRLPRLPLPHVFLLITNPCKEALKSRFPYQVPC